MTLSSGDLARMRSTVETIVLPGTAIVKTQSSVSDGMGGQTNSWTASATVAARLDYRGQHDEYAEGGRMADVGEFVLTLPRDTTISSKDVVEYDGEDFEVTAVLVRDPWDLCERCELMKIGD